MKCQRLSSADPPTGGQFKRVATGSRREAGTFPLMVCGLFAFVVAIWFAQPASFAQPLTEPNAVEAGRDALNEYTDYPWYDPEKDQLRRVDVERPDDIDQRKSKWEMKPINWTFPQWIAQLLEAVGWLVLALAILLVIYALAKAFGVGGWFSAPGTSTDTEESLHGDIDRVEALPFQLQRPQSDLLSEARRHFMAGEYSQAMIYLYSYELVQLDRHHLIRLTRGKTNRQYLREVRSQRELWEILHESMITFEDVFFGHHVLNRDRFERCWNRLGAFHQQLELIPA